MKILAVAVLPAALCVCVLAAAAQSPQNAVCSLNPPSFATDAPNIFNDKQEQDLGDALAEMFEAEMRLAPPLADDQITRIGEKLLATLPPTGIHYRFRIYDSSEINGFSITGGRVYISRKLIAALKNEDELAAVLAHEIGHLSTHQTAIYLTRAFRIRLHVTEVTDREDIFKKVHLLYNTPTKSHEDDNDDVKRELVADGVALYAMERAGYAVENLPAFLNETTMNKGNTGSWLSDLMGNTDETPLRYRAALKLIAALPAGCKGWQPAANPAFQAWMRTTVEERVKTVAEGDSGDKPLKLDSPLRPALWRIHFSPDGRYVLGQDEGGITVVEKDAAKVLFRIDAPDVKEAQFTPDSQGVVFHDSKLRVEQWSVATGKRTAVKEMIVYDGCGQTLLSPDGKTLVCTNVNVSGHLPRISLRLIDVESGKTFYDKPTFFEASEWAGYYAMIRFTLQGIEGANLATIVLSPDGRYLLVTADTKVLAYDLKSRQEVKLGPGMKGLEQTRMAFVGPDQLMIVGERQPSGMYQAMVRSFPDGAPVKETAIGDQQIDSVSKGRFLTAGPIKDYATGIFDPVQGKFLAVWKFPAIDAWDNFVATENATGEMAITQLGVPGAKQIALPLGPLPRPRAAEFSFDGKYLAVSLKNRAEIWNLETGAKAGLIRPFRRAWFDETDQLFGQFPKYLSHDPAEIKITPTPLASKELAKLDEKNWQYRNLEIDFKPLGKEKGTSEHATLEVRKMETQAVAWTRDYKYEMPACWPAEDNRLVLAWDLSNDTAKFEIKNYPELQRQAEALPNKKKGILIETVAPETGAPLQQVVVPEADVSRGENDVRRATVSGEFVLAQGEHGNTAIYRMKDGAKTGEFFGSAVASDASAGLVAAVNREDEILLVDEGTGKELKRFTLGSPVLVARIVTSGERTLLVLTADQVVHRIPLPK
jgi:WD40 repeat protein